MSGESGEVGPTTPPWRARLRSWWWLIPTIAVLFPLLRLWPLDGQFAPDWYNHRWLTAWSGEFLRQHGTTPVVINTAAQAGMPYPIFYGTLFYPLLSLLTTWLTAGVVIRAVVVAVTWLQFRLVSAALGTLEVPPWIARGIACLSIWAIYPLTNLYNRAALTEYVAVALLTSMIATFFLLIHARQPADRLRLGLGIGLLFALTAGTHPTTALYSLPILVMLLVAAYAEQGRDPAFWRGLIKALAIPVVLVVVVLAPWIYALANFQSDLRVTRDGGVWYYAGIDAWTTRFFPIPHDPRTSGVPISEVSSPFLDAQINVAMLVLLIGWLAILLWRHRAAGLAGLRAIALPLVAFAFFTWISLYPSAWHILPKFTKMLQIAYRAVSYQNLALLLAIFMLAAALRRRRERSLFESAPLASRLLVGCLLLSGAGVVIKWNHASRIMETKGLSGLRTTPSERRHTESLPKEFYGYNAYATPPRYTPVTDGERPGRVEAVIPIGHDEDFGLPQPLKLTLQADAWVGTNVQAFPWNHLLLDGVVVPQDQLRIDDIRLVLRVPAGDHTLVLDTVPDPVWEVLRPISFVALALWLVGFAVLTSRARRR